MAAQTNESAAITAKAVHVPRSLKHSFSNRVGLPDAGEKVRVPPAFARVLSTWLATGTVLVVPARSLDGGIDTWSRRIDPSVARY